MFSARSAAASAGGLYGYGRKRHKVADMDGASGISPASSDRLARRLEAGFRRLFTLIKGMIWSRRNLVLLIEFMDKDVGMNGKSPPVRLTAVQLQFDFGDL